jgi:hypothetical protein
MNLLLLAAGCGFGINLDQNKNGITAENFDQDGDGVTVDTDCDDYDDSIYPGAEEVPYDGIDQDCDSYDLTDVDGDGFDAEVVGGEDCDDDHSEIAPDHFEWMGNNTDDNCNLVIDEVNQLAVDDNLRWLSYFAGSVEGSQFGGSLIGGDVTGDGKSDVAIIAEHEPLSDYDEKAGRLYFIPSQDDGEPATLSESDPLTVSGNDEGHRLNSTAFGSFYLGEGSIAIASYGYDYEDGINNGAVGVVSAAEFVTTGNLVLDQMDLLFFGSDGSRAGEGESIAFVADPGSTDSPANALLIGARGVNEAYLLRYDDYAYASGSIGEASTQIYGADVEDPNSDFGNAVAGGQDVDGDGYPDVFVSAYLETSNLNEQGSVRVYLGGDSLMENPTPLPVQVLYGLSEYGHYGTSLESADFNHDGYGDLVVGSPLAEEMSGSVSIHLGSAEGLNETPDFLYGDESGSFFGERVSSAGDVNDDGIDDLLVGSLGSYDSTLNSGAIYLYLGNEAGFEESPDALFIGLEDMQAHVVAPGGRVAADTDAILIGAPGYDENRGVAFLIPGQSLYLED